MTHIDPHEALILGLQTPPLLCAVRTTSIRAAQPTYVGMEFGELLPLLGKLPSLLCKLVLHMVMFVFVVMKMMLVVMVMMLGFMVMVMVYFLFVVVMVVFFLLVFMLVVMVFMRVRIRRWVERNKDWIPTFGEKVSGCTTVVKIARRFVFLAVYYHPSLLAGRDARGYHANYFHP